MRPNCFLTNLEQIQMAGGQSDSIGWIQKGTNLFDVLKYCKFHQTATEVNLQDHGGSRIKIRVRLPQMLNEMIELGEHR